jgi:transposase InsO family protein
MCLVLGIPRSSYYYQSKGRKTTTQREKKTIKKIFEESREIYGSRKIKVCLERQGLILSRRRIRRIMKELNLKSKYQLAHYKHYSNQKNESDYPNLLNRQFDSTKPLETLVTDLTYIRVGQRWAYACLIIDLFNREIIGCSVGFHKTAELVKKAINSISYSLNQVQIVHTDRGKEFDNKLISEAFSVFGIRHSLSKAGCPYDNAVAESTYKAVKVEFVQGENFKTLRELEIKLIDYVHFWNYHRLHGSINYQTPLAVRLAN